MLDQWFAQIFFFTSMPLRKKCEPDNPLMFIWNERQIKRNLRMRILMREIKTNSLMLLELEYFVFFLKFEENAFLKFMNK